jgi:spore maturation protein CgeB/dTDP-glucose pyrophosphorylase
MKLVIFGLSISSSWGNGHATLWRGLCRSLAARGHAITFFERDVPYYAAHRDLTEIPGVKLCLYADWMEVLPRARAEVADADVGVVTSYCPDGVAASELVLGSNVGVRCFYDLDTPITIARLREGKPVDYLPSHGLSGFDLVLSYTGGRALGDLRRLLGAKRVVPIYGSVDPGAHHPVPPRDLFRSDLSYLGTFSADRQDALDRLFLEPARRLPERRFLIGGSMYPQEFPWEENIYYVRHVPPADHPSFYCSSKLTLNITRGAMAEMGYCPSGRLFEAAACGVPIVTDAWEGLEDFFEPGKEIILARTPEDVMKAVELPPEELGRLSRAARERALECHTSDVRARELEQAFEQAARAEPVSSQSVSWGIIPAAGIGSRIQPLAFSKELLPVGSRIDGEIERPRAVSEFLVERMARGGANRICFVISPGKSDILEYYGSRIHDAHVCYTVQGKPAGLCDALFSAIPLIRPEDQVLIGLPDTIWFPEDGFRALSDTCLSFLLFPVEHPEYFDAVVLDEQGRVLEIQVKQADARSAWVWGAFKMPGAIFHELHALWNERNHKDEYMGTLVNAWLARGGQARGVRAGEIYVDVGTLHGYREAIQVLAARSAAERSTPVADLPDAPPELRVVSS